MAVSIERDQIKVFKFRTTGLVALCEEVAELVDEGADFERWRVDVSTARFAEEGDMIQVVFDRLPEPAPTQKFIRLDATVTFEYDAAEGHVTSENAAVRDFAELVGRGLTFDQFVIETETVER